MACPGRYNPWNVLRVTNNCYFGDWLFLYYIAKNLDNYIFKELLEQLAHDMEERDHHTVYPAIIVPDAEEQLLSKEATLKKD